MLYFLIVLSIFFASAGIAGLISAPYVPTRKKDVARFLALADIKEGELVYDLGCGDGRLLTAAAKAGAKAIGLEISLPNYLFCKIFKRNIKTKFKNFFNGDYKNADVVYMFLSQSSHDTMGRVLQKQMKKGSRIVTYAWPIKGFVAEKVDKIQDRPALYLYKL